uniref:Uncharacterized protein n=1 Tax=Romanomermis culicivorax TaxID=13658 RepID=A0A915HYL1_ROMCU
MTAVDSAVRRFSQRRRRERRASPPSEASSSVHANVKKRKRKKNARTCIRACKSLADPTESASESLAEPRTARRLPIALYLTPLDDASSIRHFCFKGL